MEKRDSQNEEFLINLNVMCENHNILYEIVCLECEKLLCIKCIMSHIKDKNHKHDLVEIKDAIAKKYTEIERTMAEINKNDEEVSKSLQISLKTKGKMLDKASLNGLRENAIYAINKIIEEEYEKRNEIIKSITIYEGILNKQRALNIGYMNICKGKISKMKKGNAEYQAKLILDQFMQKKAGKKEILEEIEEKIKKPDDIPIIVQNSSDITKKIEGLFYELSKKAKLESEKLIQNASKEIFEFYSGRVNSDQKENSNQIQLKEQQKNDVFAEEIKQTLDEIFI